MLQFCIYRLGNTWIKPGLNQFYDYVYMWTFPTLALHAGSLWGMIPSNLYNIFESIINLNHSNINGDDSYVAANFDHLHTKAKWV